MGRAVAVVSAIFDRHRLFLRAIVLVSSRHPEVARRGAARRRELCDIFTDVLAPTDARSPHRDPLAARVVLVGVLWIAVAGIVVVRRGYVPARLFMLAWAMFLLGTTMFTLVAFGALPKTFYTEYGVQIGS